MNTTNPTVTEGQEYQIVDQDGRIVFAGIADSDEHAIDTLETYRAYNFAIVSVWNRLHLRLRNMSDR